MALRFINKHVTNLTPQKVNKTSNAKHENKENKTEDSMVVTEKLDMVDGILNDKAVKKVKKDKSLIERTESSKTIITEDNKQVLFG